MNYYKEITLELNKLLSKLDREIHSQRTKAGIQASKLNKEIKSKENEEKN